MCNQISTTVNCSRIFVSVSMEVIRATPRLLMQLSLLLSSTPPLFRGWTSLLLAVTPLFFFFFLASFWTLPSSPSARLRPGVKDCHWLQAACVVLHKVITATWAATTTTRPQQQQQHPPQQQLLRGQQQSEISSHCGVGDTL